MPRKRRRQKRGNINVASEAAVRPPVERFQHGDVIEPARSSRAMHFGDKPPLQNRTSSMLDRYLVMKGADGKPVISQGMYSAGTKLYAEWRASGCEPKLTGSYGVRVDRSGGIDQRQANFRILVSDALDAVGPLCARILIHVCLCDGSAKEWALARGMAEKVAKSYGIWLLKDALDCLNDHYRERG